MGLRDLVLEVLAEGGEPDPRLVADQVLERLSSHRVTLRDALAESLPTFTRTVIQESRRNHFDKPRPGRSWKADGIRDWWTKRLDSVYAVETEDGFVWLPLRAMTYDDLMSAASMRRKKADETIAVAESLEALATLMKRRKAARVEDLPRDALASVFGEAA